MYFFCTILQGSCVLFFDWIKYESACRAVYVLCVLQFKKPFTLEGKHLDKHVA